MGLCFLILTSLEILKVKGKTYLDEVTVLAVILFMLSSFTSFLSMKSKERLAMLLENAADYIFLMGLVVLFIATLLIAFDRVS